jgi:iduronate 2-sulfatase
VAYSYFNRGISLRTDRYRLTKYFRKQEPTVELYDHTTDPNENRNIAGDNPDIVEKLTPLWAKGNTGIFE